METNFHLFVQFVCFFVLILPMRNGNSLLYIDTCTEALVLILPMRNGNVSISPTNSLIPLVLILPMRNGNPNKKKSILRHSTSSYPTYEEWKLPRTYTSSIAICSVLILPMRNGNILAPISKLSPSK